MTVLHRRWADLRLWRLCLGLAAAPLPIAFVILVGVSTIEQPTLERLLWYARVIVECTVIWSLVAGLAYFIVVTRQRMKLARAECLALGAVTGGLFPDVIMSFRHFAPLAVLGLMDLHPHTRPLLPELFDWTSPSDFIMTSVFAVAGAFSGWILWGVAVRPAPLPPPDIAAFN
jgi:hypothetical protein